MKIKEEYSNVFKKDDMEIRTVKQKGALRLIEERKRLDDLPYSRYLLFNDAINESYITIDIPDPLEKDIYKDIFLKYQNGARTFLIDLFNVLIGDKKDIEPMYKHKEPKEFRYEKKEDKFGTVWIRLLSDDTLFMRTGFFTEKRNLNIAKKFINYFGGIDTSFKEEYGLLNKWAYEFDKDNYLESVRRILEDENYEG